MGGREVRLRVREGGAPERGEEPCEPWMGTADAKASSSSAMSTACCAVGRPRPWRPTVVVTSGMPCAIAITFFVAIPVPLKTGATKALWSYGRRRLQVAQRAEERDAAGGDRGVERQRLGHVLEPAGPREVEVADAAGRELGGAEEGWTRSTSHSTAITASPCIPPT